MPVQVTFTVEHCGQPIVGLWCSWCSLSAGIAAVLLVNGRPTVYTQCRECRRRL